MLRRTFIQFRPYFPAIAARKENFSKKSSRDPCSHYIPTVAFNDPDYLPVPDYPFRPNESLETRKQRLLYQSRKRGILENDLLLSTFAAKFLKDLSKSLTDQYDQLINGVNDWDIFYWTTGIHPVPPEYDNEIMRMLKDHVSNSGREQRLRQPNLYDNL